MPEREKVAALPWHVPVALDDVPEEGQHFDLAADADTRAAVARVAGLRDLPRLEASFDLSRSGRAGLHVAGRVSATAGQTCVVTLEPLANEVSEDIDLLFEPPPAVPAEADRDAGTPERNSDDETEPLVDGKVDLGALATEFLILGLDPYPRKPGAVFQPPTDAGPDEGPFAALGALKKGRDGG
jgi:uncharacterized metal-binding protein YceD (DUF177 family)